MIITQKSDGDYWSITVDFENASLTKNHLPIFITGNFNKWKTDFECKDEKFRISAPKDAGEHILKPYTIKVPRSWNYIEFRLFNSKGFMKFEEYEELFKGDISYISNFYGTENVIVYNKF